MYAGRVCACAKKEVKLPLVSHYGEIALSGSRRLRSTLAAAPVLFAHAVVTVAENRTSTTLTKCAAAHRLSVLCICSKAWLAARTSLRLARLPRTTSSAQRSTRAAVPVLLAHAEVTRT
jgi:hypothetical protein